MNENEIVRAAESRMARSERREEPRDPSMERANKAVDDLAENAFLALRGTDTELEQAVAGLRKLRDDTLSAAGTLDAMAQRVRRGELSGDTVPRLRSAFRDEADRQLRAATKRVQEQIHAARERAVDALLPPLQADGGKSAEWKGDVRDALAAADGSDASGRFIATWRRYVAEGNREPLRLLASSWGRDLFRTAGGTAEGWAELREALVAELVETPAYKENPTAVRIRKLRSRTVREAADGTASQVLSAISRLDKAGE